MKVSEIMTSNPACCTPDMGLEEAARMMAECDCGALPVVDEQKNPIGTITDRDIVMRTLAQGRNPMDCSVQDCMTESTVTIDQDSDVNEAARMMAQNQIRRLMVTDGSSQIIGMVAQADVARSTSDEMKGQMVEEISEPVGRSQQMQNR